MSQLPPFKIKYVSGKGGTRISAFRVVRETDKVFWYLDTQDREQRSNKETSYDRLHDTKAQARDFLIEQNKTDLKHTEDRVARIKANLAELEAMEVAP